MLKQILRAFGSGRWWLVFFLAGVFFLLFGVMSYNLFALLKANFTLFVEHGWIVVADGALRQLLELLGLSYLSLMFWLLFKYCENLLVRALTPPPPPSQHP